MNRNAIAAGALFLVLALWYLPGGNRADESYEKEAREVKKEIVEMARLVEKGKDISARAVAMSKKYDDLDPIMWCFKAKSKGGIGAGKTFSEQSIELKIIRLSRQILTREQLANQKSDLIRIAAVSAAVAEVTAHYGPEVGGRRKREEWKKLATEMKKFSLELMAAVKAGDPRKVRRAASKLSDSCLPCHTVGRD
jgi:hypothetical protein